MLHPKASGGYSIIGSSSREKDASMLKLATADHEDAAPWEFVKVNEPFLAKSVGRGNAAPFLLFVINHILILILVYYLVSK